MLKGMKITLGRLFDSKDALTKLAEAELPVNEAYNVSRILKSAQQELTFLDQERQKLVKKYSDEPDKDGNIKVKDENFQQFMEEFVKVLELQVEIAGDPIDISKVGDEVKLTAKDMIVLEPLLKNSGESVKSEETPTSN